MGKHDRAETMPEALERHYIEQIRERDTRIKQLETRLDGLKAKLEEMAETIANRNSYINELETAVIKAAVKSTKGE